jgi:ankyrin repeat protein
LLKYIERGSSLKLNEVNRQGLTPLDISIEVKQNQALEFAIYFNKNMLPALATPRRKELFDINFNKNQRGLTPLHRAIVTQNYKAIYLLLQSEECNLYIKDKDFKSARDYC